ncbi:MAG: hypothetical protein AB7G34_02925 [Hyphomicrobiales bacterium]
MIVINRNGETVVLTGWRAWLAMAAGFAVMLAVVALVLFVLLGIALTMGMFLLVAIPVAAILTLFAWLTAGRAAR